MYDESTVCHVVTQLVANCVLLQIECVGGVSCGIKAATWSPDLDLVVILTGLHKT